MVKEKLVQKDPRQKKGAGSFSFREGFEALRYRISIWRMCFSISWRFWGVLIQTPVAVVGWGNGFPVAATIQQVTGVGEEV